jgi:TatD DNase family protein
LIVHARDADDDIIKIIREEISANPSQKLTGVMHCFSSGRQMAMDALDLGFYISASGMITFKKSEELRDIFKDVPMDRLLVETDAPFLAPDPYRGKINEPAFVIHTGAKLAEIKGVSVDEMAAQTTNNFYNLFTRAHKI